MGKSMEYLLTHDFTGVELCDLDSAETVIALWHEQGIKVVEECKKVEPFNGACKEFLEHCTTCGGDWGNMFLSGVKELYPNVWKAIPNNMGVFSFLGIAETLCLLGVNMD